jgi:hypothetical protein
MCQSREWEEGDCYRACLASILNVPASFVPHFAEEYKHQDSFHEEVDAWLAPFGLVTFNMVMSPEEPAADVPVFWNNINPGVPAILSGLAYNFGRHSVVIHNGNVYDPSGAGMVSPIPPWRQPDGNMHSGGWWISGVSVGDNFVLRKMPSV